MPNFKNEYHLRFTTLFCAIKHCANLYVHYKCSMLNIEMEIKIKIT